MNRKSLRTLLLATATLAAFSSCSNNGNSENSAPKNDTAVVETKTPSVKSEDISIQADSVVLKSFVAYDENSTAKRPVVIIVPEWWGLNDYAKNRAKQLAELGYLALALDIYGNGKTGDDPKAAMELAGPFYKNPAIGTKRIEAAIAQAKTYAQADSNKIAAIGYCFGGAMVLNAARMGAPLKAVVSFHGGLMGAKPNKDAMKAQILVCHGADDKFVPETEVAAFKKQMDSVGAKYTFKQYAGATHAFTNPDATKNGEKFKLPIAYNGAADTASWKDMKDFFNQVLY